MSQMLKNKKKIDKTGVETVSEPWIIRDRMWKEEKTFFFFLFKEARLEFSWEPLDTRGWIKRIPLFVNMHHHHTLPKYDENC